MNETKRSRFSKRYLAALRSHLAKTAPSFDLHAAHALGKQAVLSKLETLDIAAIHEHALKFLLTAETSPAGHDDIVVRGTHFFNEVITPIEETRAIAVEAAAELVRLSAALVQRTLDLAASQLELQRHVSDRKTSESALLSSKLAARQLLRESQRLEKRLKTLTREILAADEIERKKMSLHLYDEIAQTLLAIHVRLLSLKREADADNAGLVEEIATTQRLLEQSVKIVNRFAIEFGSKHET